MEALELLLTLHPRGITGRGWDILALSKNKNLGLSYIHEHPELPWNWNEISYRLILDPIYSPSNLLREHANKLNWVLISKYCNLSYTDIINMINYIDIPLLSGNPNLNLTSKEWGYLINRFLRNDTIGMRLDVDRLSSNPRLPDDIIVSYEAIWNWKLLSANPALKFYLIEKYLRRLHPTTLSQNPNLPEHFIVRYAQQLDMVYISKSVTTSLIDILADVLRWRLVSRYAPLTLVQVNRYRDRIDMELLSSNPNITDDIIVAYSEELNWLNLSYDVTLSTYIIDRFSDKVKWSGVCATSQMDGFLIDKYASKIDWKSLSGNYYIGVDYIMNNPDRPWDLKKICKRI